MTGRKAKKDTRKGNYPITFLFYHGMSLEQSGSTCLHHCILLIGLDKRTVHSGFYIVKLWLCLEKCLKNYGYRKMPFLSLICIGPFFVWACAFMHSICAKTYMLEILFFFYRASAFWFLPSQTSVMQFCLHIMRSKDVT